MPTTTSTNQILVNGAVIAAGLATASYLWHQWRASRGPNLPPSPKGYPIIGNVFSLPSDIEHLAYMEIGRRLNSSIFTLNMFDYNLVIVNSAEAASELFEKRSALYSDRACPHIVNDPTLFDWSGHVSLLGYNDTWRAQRRMMHNWLNVRASNQFHSLQTRHARALLTRLLPASKMPQPFDMVVKEFYRSMAASIFETIYGYHIQDNDDKFLMGTRMALEHLFKATMRTNFWVNLFPILSYVPDWMPGTQWKRTVRQWRAEKDWVVDGAYQWTKDQLANGSAESSILASLFGHDMISQWTPEEADRQLKEFAIIMCAGALDPTSNTLVKFVAAMVLNPEAQEKAQREIDSVTGQNRLPTIADRARMPYVQNLISEVLRWHPVLPMGLHRVCFQDDIYRGYDIPKGTILMGNVWAMSRDENVYKNPETFDPDRFLDPGVPPVPSFGWGRRKCPGIHFGETAVFVTVAHLLATYSFSKKRDAGGKEIIPKIEGVGNALALTLKEFEFEMTPRSERCHQLILEGV